MPVFKNSRSNRDKVVTILQNASKVLTWPEVITELETNTPHDANAYMTKWCKAAVLVNSLARKARLSGQINEAVKFEKEIENMVDTGEFFRNSA